MLTRINNAGMLFRDGGIRHPRSLKARTIGKERAKKPPNFTLPMSSRPSRLAFQAPTARRRFSSLLLVAIHLAFTHGPAAAEASPDDGTLLTLPVRFHVTQGATMTVKDRKMEVWVEPADLTGPVIAEVNRIWQPAKIRFVVERAHVEPLIRPVNFDELVHLVQNSKRGEEERFGSRRTETIAKLLDPAHRHP